MTNKFSIQKIKIISAILLTTILVVIGNMFYFGLLRFNYPSFKSFPIQGIDISHHQGKINWKKLKKSPYSFVYIKATEGGDFVDPRFKNNFDNALKNNFAVGAYHFFTFRKSGKVQAENFISQVSEDQNLLPPVIDLEYMGNSKMKSSKKTLHKELSIFIKTIENHYNYKPILYTTYEFYNKYLSNSFLEYDIWIRDIFKKPQIEANRSWIFWQYSNRGKIEGISGYVDLNVFNGNIKDFENYFFYKKEK